MFTFHLLLGSPSINPSGEQDSSPTPGDKGSIYFFGKHPHAGPVPGQVSNLSHSTIQQCTKAGVEQWCTTFAVHHITDDALTAGLFVEQGVKLGLDADRGSVPLHWAWESEGRQRWHLSRQCHKRGAEVTSHGQQLC